MRHEALIRPGMSAARALMAALQVSDASEHAMQLQMTVSSPDSGLNDSLCSSVRAALIDFLQRSRPECLPRLRIEQQAGVHNGAR